MIPYTLLHAAERSPEESGIKVHCTQKHTRKWVLCYHARYGQKEIYFKNNLKRFSKLMLVRLICRLMLPSCFCQLKEPETLGEVGYRTDSVVAAFQKEHCSLASWNFISYLRKVMQSVLTLGYNDHKEDCVICFSTVCVKWKCLQSKTLKSLCWVSSHLFLRIHDINK